MLRLSDAAPSMQPIEFVEPRGRFELPPYRLQGDCLTARLPRLVFVAGVGPMDPPSAFLLFNWRKDASLPRLYFAPNTPALKRTAICYFRPPIPARLPTGVGLVPLSLPVALLGIFLALLGDNCKEKVR